MGSISDDLEPREKGPTRADIERLAIWDSLAAIEARLDLVELWLTTVVDAAEPPPAGSGPDPEAVRHLLALAARRRERAKESQHMMAVFHGLGDKAERG